MSARRFETFDQFAEALLEAGIAHIVLREVHEIRPSGVAGAGPVVVGLVHNAKLLAYRAGELLECVIAGDEIVACVQWLATHAIQVKRVSDNIG